VADLAIGQDCPVCRQPATLQVSYRFEDDLHYVVGCKACTVQAIMPFPTRAELKEYYFNYQTTRTPEEEMPLLIARHVDLFQWLRSRWQVPCTRDVRYMEVGFGNGASLLAAAQLGMNVSGYDLDPNNVLDVERRARALDLPVWIQRGDLNEALERNEKFDLVKASQVIEHVIDPVQFVVSMSGLLNPGGYLYLECPNNAASFLRIKNHLRRPFGRMNFYNSLKVSEHLWGFNRISMPHLLRGRGFEVLFCTDYPVRHRYFQPENLFWYPSLPSGLGRSISERNLYPLLKSLIAVFDWAMSLTVSGGIGLAALARKPAPA
jgi:2-polyprenyl-3-methyl-5-hydroxy-6-metoxy-1,4-benzoquinol methylase